MQLFFVGMERLDGYELPLDYILVFAYTPREAMFNAGAQAALLGCTECIGLNRPSLDAGRVSYVSADGLEVTCLDMHDGRFWEVFASEAYRWGEQLSQFANSFRGAAWSFKQIAIAMEAGELFETEPALAGFNAGVEAYEIEQELPLGTKRKSQSI